MKLLQRKREQTASDDDNVRLPADEAPEPQPGHDEPELEDPRRTQLSKRDHLAIVKRAFKRFNADHMTNIAAALAYYAFLAIPATLMIAAGLFGLLAGPSAVSTVIDKLHGIVPGQAASLLDESLRNLPKN